VADVHFPGCDIDLNPDMRGGLRIFQNCLATGGLGIRGFP
jgi:hypothetical protein